MEWLLIIINRTGVINIRKYADMDSIRQNKSGKWIERTRKIIYQVKGLSDARKHIKLINQFHVLSFTRSIFGLKFEEN